MSLLWTSLGLIVSQSWLVAELEENQALATMFLLKNYDYIKLVFFLQFILLGILYPSHIVIQPYEYLF